ncbi:hypothetical protein VIBNISFn27_660038 [Vibrio nigripulchritudo SFn27]|uniref:Sel1 repeat family protein n=1 Tax=Vibrio nigripulchritudo SOn1 TaxID=1238450 RepID=A0AAV2VRP7_9VIBR|nr:hypothetical protein VIBNIBLFn1_520061 [Vibrio nigripulchritudo BLFn1]CCN89619.1 hypothetical protein VIBNISFn27_660038 [Vibrio nigripulchritudo SFn27]CCN94422.1 hypothetical protein VIBNIENn2_380061 [Vibrio nigripulchritudo ENn2]CCO39804.1 hypothetical protein VIBNISFn135_180062 [Vibrio nigripulchritudo SFn135]CCO47344.1 hypothetical protein VIBNISOn1_30035 [Vibrio nigripulchritudo SOn1]CCO52283.1 hypothetical protein VIBNIWn13_280038 [Vibrio nigripulchritudo Wn13]
MLYSRFLLGISIVGLSGCAIDSKIDHPCLNGYLYSKKFIDSQFVEAWQLIDTYGVQDGCDKALPILESAVIDNEYVDLAALYYDYCTSSVGRIIYYNSSSIYSGEDRGDGLSLDELYWIRDMSSCRKPVEQFAAGLFYLNGYHVEKNTDAAIFLLNSAARSGYGHAQFQLALALMEIGEEDNAKLWLAKAVESGYTKASNLLEALEIIEASE